jgi:hypothetical protein
MAVTKATTPAQQAPEVAAAPNVNLELSRTSRYFFRDTLYEKGVVYVFDAASAQIMLRLLDPQSLPMFGLAKPRTKLVQIPVEVQTVAIKAVASQEIEQHGNLKIAPVGQLDLGDGEEDAELSGRLARADAELIDTGAPVTV